MPYPPSLYTEPPPTPSESTLRTISPSRATMPAPSPPPASVTKNWKTICHHNRRKTQCVLCFDLGIGGGSICEHRRRRDVCSTCRRPSTAAANTAKNPPPLFATVAVSPPSPPSDRPAAGGSSSSSKHPKRSRSCSATPLLDDHRVVPRELHVRDLAPDTKHAVSLPLKLGGASSSVVAAPGGPSPITTSAYAPIDLARPPPMMPPNRAFIPYPYPQLPPVPVRADYARDYAAYCEALDFLYYERARAAAAHQHYMAAAAAAAADAHYRPLYWPPPPQPPQALPVVYPASGSLPPMPAPVIRPATTPHALARPLPLLPPPAYPAASAPAATQLPPGRLPAQPASSAPTAMAHAPPPPPPPPPASAVVAKTPPQAPTYKTVFAPPAAAVTSAC